MTKQHSKPEFTVIRQNEANAKFFVASGSVDFVNDYSQTQDPSQVAASYDTGSGNSNDITM